MQLESNTTAPQVIQVFLLMGMSIHPLSIHPLYACQIALQKKQKQLHQNVYLVELAFQTPGGGSEERSQSADFSEFSSFPSDNAVNSVETWFCLPRMLANVGSCSRSFSREIALI